MLNLILARLRSWQKSASVEPSYFFSVLASALLGFGNTNLYLQKACRNDTAIEPDLSTPCDDVERGVINVTTINTYVTPIASVIVIITVILYSSCSERTNAKLKLILMMAMVGHLLESGLMCLHAYWWSLSPLSAAVTNAILHAICGNRITLATFASLYLANLVDEKNRTVRFIILSAITTFGFLVADSFSGHLLHAVGFFWYYLICSYVSSLAIICGHIFIEDHSAPLGRLTSAEFSFRPIVTSLRVTLGKGSKRQRAVITLCLFTHTLLIFIHHGQSSVIYLYLKYRFHWNEVMYSYFLLCSCLGSMFGTMFSSLILIRTLKIPDAVIGVITTAWDALVALNYIFAVSDWQLYSISGMDIFFGVSATVCVANVTKFFDTSEMGHVYAVKAIFCLLIYVFHATYSIILEMTLHTMPYAFFIVSFVLYSTGTLIYSIIYLLSKEQIQNNQYKYQRL